MQLQPYARGAAANLLAMPDPGDISRSWQRCRMAGLTPERSGVDAHAVGAQLRTATDRRAALVTQARPVMDYIYAQIKDSGCVMLLSDEDGYLLEAAGDADFCNRAAQVALQPGACWAEEMRGTNAIGTALIERKPIVVRGAEHYLRHNGFLACAAAPLVEPGGKLLGVLDLSCDSRLYHPHTFGLVRAAGQMIENRMFEVSFATRMKMRFHMSSGSLGSAMEGAIALSEDGVIEGANRMAFGLLGLSLDDIGRNISEFFNVKFPDLVDLDRRALGRPAIVHTCRGQMVYFAFDNVQTPAPPRFTVAASSSADALDALDTGDERIRKTILQLRRVLGRPVPILLQGETGAGKDMFARAIHAAGPRGQKPFVAVNCAALPESLIEAELFGHVAGAFTGAKREGAAGRIREADGGTLFLDEIGDMPVQMQTRLLRVLEDGHVTPIGGKPVPVDFLLISATHCDFKARIAAQTFRADLFYRLNGFSVCLPPARERTDLPTLIGRILAREAKNRGGGTPVLRLSDELAVAFAKYHWPGNLRQLSAMLRTACLMLDERETEICLRHLSEAALAELLEQCVAPADAPAPTSTLRAHTDAMILHAVSEAGGNIAAASRHLGISRNTLYRRLAASQPSAA